MHQGSRSVRSIPLLRHRFAPFSERSLEVASSPPLRTALERRHTHKEPPSGRSGTRNRTAGVVYRNHKLASLVSNQLTRTHMANFTDEGEQGAEQWLSAQGFRLLAESTTDYAI